ncbi:MAG: hypothetical protein EZS28_049319, partial [Streblomastix strix]
TVVKTASKEKQESYIVVNKKLEKRYKKTANIKGIKYTEGRNGSKERLYFDSKKLEKEARAWLEQNKEEYLSKYRKLLNVNNFDTVMDGNGKSCGMVLGYLGGCWIDTDNIKIKQLYRFFGGVYRNYMEKLIRNTEDFKTIIKTMEKNGCPLGAILWQEESSESANIYAALEYGADFGYITHDQMKKYSMRIRRESDFGRQNNQQQLTKNVVVIPNKRLTFVY